MANQSAFSILAYQRKLGSWRAAVSRKDGAPVETNVDTLKSFITDEDCSTEEEAIKAGQKAISEI